MYSDIQFAALEIMSRQRAEVAKKEMEYWLAEAEEWKRIRESPDPSQEGIANRSSALAKSNYSQVE